MGRLRSRLVGAALVAAIGIAGCGSPSWKQHLAAELEAAEERWSEASARRVTYTVRQTACDGCDASALDEAVAVVWSDGQASTTAPTEPAGYAPSDLFGFAEQAIEQSSDEEDVTLTFDDEIGLPTRINLIWEAVDDGDFGFVVEVTGVE